MYLRHNTRCAAVLPIDTSTSNKGATSQREESSGQRYTLVSKRATQNEDMRNALTKTRSRSQSNENSETQEVPTWLAEKLWSGQEGEKNEGAPGRTQWRNVCWQTARRNNSKQETRNVGRCHEWCQVRQEPNVKRVQTRQSKGQMELWSNVQPYGTNDW